MTTNADRDLRLSPGSFFRLRRWSPPVAILGMVGAAWLLLSPAGVTSPQDHGFWIGVAAASIALVGYAVTAVLLVRVPRDAVAENGLPTGSNPRVVNSLGRMGRTGAFPAPVVGILAVANVTLIADIWTTGAPRSLLPFPILVAAVLLLVVLTGTLGWALSRSLIVGVELTAHELIAIGWLRTRRFRRVDIERVDLAFSGSTIAAFMASLLSSGEVDCLGVHVAGRRYWLHSSASSAEKLERGTGVIVEWLAPTSRG